MQAYIGTSGWQYRHWRGDFYPKELALNSWLNYYVKRFNSVEINSSFYRIPKKSSFETWRKIAADHNPKFIFSVKLYLWFTRYKKLIIGEPDKALLKNFFENALGLGKSLGPILVQLPPNLKFDAARLEKFLKTARQIGVKSGGKFRFAVEFRNNSWLRPETYNILSKEKAAFVISDTARWQTDPMKTTDFVFARFHGRPKMFVSDYSNQTLDTWNRKLTALKPRQLFAYFNNDSLGFAPKNAEYLAAKFF